jgi:hypothetical protein
MANDSGIFTTTVRIPFYNSWKQKLWKIGDALLRISSKTSSFQYNLGLYCPYSLVPDPQNFLNFQKSWDHSWVARNLRHILFQWESGWKLKTFPSGPFMRAGHRSYRGVLDCMSRLLCQPPLFPTQRSLIAERITLYWVPYTLFTIL